jgi:virulence factor Mce-like protein
MERRRNAIVGGVALLVIVAFVYALFLYLGGTFKTGNSVEATFARAGQLLREGSDVKMRGVLVGSVSLIKVAPSGEAHVTLLLDPVNQIPANVDAAIRAKTLFGEKFVELILPKQPSTNQLGDGDKIPRNRTTPPIEVETILSKAVPILEAVDPEAFGAGLHGLARGLSGNEEALRKANVQSLKLLTETEKTLPNLERNLVHLKHFAAALNATDTDLLDALQGLTEVGEVIRDNPDAFRRTVSGLVPLANDLGDILTARKTDLGDLAGKGRAVLETVAKRSSKLPALVDVLDGFLGVWVMDLSEGPNWRIAVTDPPIVMGEPYGPGEAPSPRTRSLALPSGDTQVKQLVGLLLDPIEETLRPADGIDPLVGSLLLSFGQSFGQGFGP